MLKNYLKIAWRNMLKNKSIFIINVIGLSTGLSCVMLIFLWVNDELNMDKFHENDEQLYQVMEVMNANGEISVNPDTQGLLAETMAQDFPEVEKATTFFSLVKEGYDFNLKTTENKIIKAGAIFADTAFFEIFTYPLVAGNSVQVLQEKESTVISESLAFKLFGSTENALGQTVDFNFFGMEMLVKVTGIMKDVPFNSTHQFDFVLTKGTLFDMAPPLKEWSNEGTNTFLKLKAGTDVTAFNAKIKNYLNTYTNNARFTLFVRPYSSAYLYDSYSNGKQTGGRIGYVKLFSLIGLFILFIACVNFMNLSTAAASKREKEIGVKKAIGSSRKNLVFQFLTESLLTVAFSLAAAVLFVFLVLPEFNAITGKAIAINLNPNTLIALLLVLILTGLVAGSYPAFYLSGLKTLNVTKRTTKNTFANQFARKGLVVFQFVVSITLIISVLMVDNQMDFIQNMSLGYNKENVIFLERDGALMKRAESFLHQVREIPEVINASAIQGAMAQDGDNSNTGGLSWEGKNEDRDLVFSIKTVDFDLIETLDIQMAEGRSFSKEFSTENDKIIFNETAIKSMGIENPIGKKVNMWGDEKIIIGVTKDFFANSVHEKIRPTLFRYAPERTSQVVIRLKSGTESAAIQKLKALYADFNPGYPFNYKFMDENFQKLYTAEQRVSVLSKYFAGLAILISCLGLVGLAMFNAKQRAKEIGIRKVLGASVSKLVFLLSFDFIKLALIAVFIAFPLSWFALHKWLQNYAYRTDFSFNTFIMAFIGILLTVILSVSYQAFKSASVNPVTSLKSE